MAEIRPFPALHFAREEELSRLTCPPYDIISPSQREALLAEDPCNIVRLELPQGGEDRYRQAGRLLDQWLAEGVLLCGGQEAFYLYEEEFTVRGRQRSVRGLIARVKLCEFSEGVVLPHEETLSKAKTDRLNLMKATGCNFSSIYSLFFDGDGQVRDIFDRVGEGEPRCTFTDGDGVTHRLWVIGGPADIQALIRLMADKKLYIADGHHRYETALNYRRWLQEEGREEDAAKAGAVLMTLTPMEEKGLTVFPTHRIVRGLEGFSPAALLEQCRKSFDVSPLPPEEAAVQAALDAAYEKGEKAMAFCAGKAGYLLVLRDFGEADRLLAGFSPAYRRLDVSILHSLVLERFLGIDKENMASQKNLTYTRSAAEALRAVRTGEADCAFLINPTRVEEIAAVAAAGEKMPQKSTYFYPKLVTGMVMNKML